MKLRKSSGGAPGAVRLVRLSSKWLPLGLLLALWAGCGKADSGRRTVDLGGPRLQVQVMGRGSPAVVFDSGVGDSLEKLLPLARRVAAVSRVCLYNRAGYGGSDPGPLPRNAGREAEELKTLLERVGLPGPYLLVGHSLGALNAQVFAAKYPRAVAGLVLMDPPPLTFLLGETYPDLRELAGRMTTEWQNQADAAGRAEEPRARVLAGFLRMIASEHREMFGESARQAAAIASFGGTPLVVMASGRANSRFGPGAQEYQRYWIEQSRQLAGKSTSGRFILATNSSHYIYIDAPDLVNGAVLSLLEQVRRKGYDSPGTGATRMEGSK